MLSLFRYPLQVVRLRAVFALAGLALFGTTATAQPWRSAYYPETWAPPGRADGLDFITSKFLQDFSYAGYHLGRRPLPRVTGPVFDVVTDFGADPTGRSDATAAIQTAINTATAAGGGVVYLPAGTFQLSLPANAVACLTIRASGIVLRGAGAGLTFLHNTTTDMRGHRVIRVQEPRGGSWTNAAGDPVLITRDELGPTRELQLATVDGFSVGDSIIVYNPSTADFINDLKMGPGADGVNWLENPDAVRGPRNLRRIESIDTAARTITIDAPTRWQLRTRDAASVYPAPASISEVGLEHFSIGNTRHPGTCGWAESDYSVSGRSAYDTHDSYLIELAGVTNGWIQNVSSYNPGNDNDAHMLSNGITLNWCRAVTIRQTTMARAQYGGGGGNGYGIRLNAANECLVIDSETGWLRHGFVFWRTENSGNVVTGCYDHHSGQQQGNGTVTPTAGTGSDHHGIFSHSNLHDNNRVEHSRLEAAYRGNSGSNPAHGTSSSQSVFWNITGLAYLRSEDEIVHSQQFGHGYIIGTQGPASAIRLNEKRPNSAERTNPVDVAEGIGESARLVPQSLYLDQLERRLGAESAWLTGPAAILRQPAAQLVEIGASVSLEVQVRTPTAVTYQWLKDGVALPGATAARLDIPATTAADQGSYQVRISSTDTTVLSEPAELTVGLPAPGRIVNGSVLSRIEADAPLTIGFNLVGGPRDLLLRGVGPSLEPHVGSGTASNPTLDVYRSGQLLTRNLDWNQDPALASASTEAGAFTLASSLDAVVRQTFQPGTHTAVLSADSGSGGTALIEIYPLPASTETRGSLGELGNFSVLRKIDAAHPSLTAGFVIRGDFAKSVLIRAIGPSLEPYVSDTFLPDPTLTVYQLSAPTNEIAADVDDWQEPPTWSTTEDEAARLGAFPLDRGSADAAIVLTLEPGAYSAVLARKPGQQGLGLVEIYELP